MRLKLSMLQQYGSVLDFWQSTCYYTGETMCQRGRCCNPKTAEYQKTCDEIWQKWHKAGGNGKLPVMPPQTVECEKCKYSDSTLGVFQGNASPRIVSRTIEGTIPVPIKGRKKIWLDNVNQKQLEYILNEIDSDIEAFAITGSPTITDFAFLEKFSNLKYVYLWWNNKVTSLWNITQTPNIEYLDLEEINNLSDISQLQNAKKLRYLKICGGKASINSLKPIENLRSLEFISLCRNIADIDMRHLISIPNLKYFDCHFNIFDIEDYAMFEAKRPDVDTNFWEGIADYDYERRIDDYYTGLVGKRQGLVKNDNIAKLEKHREKYLSIKQKCLTKDL